MFFSASFRGLQLHKKSLECTLRKGERVKAGKKLISRTRETRQISMHVNYDEITSSIIILKRFAKMLVSQLVYKRAAT